MRALIALIVTVFAILLAPVQAAHRTFGRLDARPWFRPALAIGMLAVLVWHPAGLLAAPLFMGVLTEGQHTGEFIFTEAPGSISRDTVTVTVAANTTLKPGAVLGQISLSGKYVPYDDSHSDGSEEAAGLLYSQLVNATGAPVDMAGVVINAVAEVRSGDLVWKDGVDHTAALVDLAARFIKVRSDAPATTFGY